MTECGNIIKKNSGRVTVRIMRREACNGCNACGMSGKHLDVIVENTLDAKVGDSVEIDFKPSSDRGFAVIAYLVPLLFTALGIMIGTLSKLHELYIVLIAFIMLGLGFAAAFFIDKKVVRKKKLNPVISKIVKENNNE